MEQSSNNTNGGNKAVAIIFLTFFLVIFCLVSLTSIPGQDAVNIYREGKEFISQNKDFYFLRAGSYKVLDEYDEYVVRQSKLNYAVHHYYFNVMVTDIHGQSFIMPVRTDKKTEALRNGESIKLFGMASVLDEEEQNSRASSLSDLEQGIPVIDVCLYDSDDSVEGLYAQAILFGIFAALDTALIGFIAFKR